MLSTLRLDCKSWAILLQSTQATTMPTIVLKKQKTVRSLIHCHRTYTELNRIGTLTVHAVSPPFPRSLRGKLHILFAHLSQIHLTAHVLSPSAPEYDVYFVDQLSTCIPLLRLLARKRVVFYCHFPDKLLANGAYVEGQMRGRGNLLKRIYRWPMDWLEEFTTRTFPMVRNHCR